ncbi:MAG: PTS sugar transporter subunit IIA [Anaerolineae bacterium]
MNISDLLQPQAVLLQLEAADSSEVIQRLGGILHRLGYVKDGFVEATLGRESTMPTGLPLGGSVNAAIPHVDLEYVERPALALATLKKPVVFRNMVDVDDEVPVRLVIMLALDQPKSQIAMLQQIAAILQSPEVVDRLMAAKTKQDIFGILKEVEASV